MLRRVLLSLLCTASLAAAAAQDVYDDAPTGDAAIAERYAAWAQRAVDKGRWAEAEAALERAQDFADVSSDLSYLLAMVRRHENRSPGAVLEAARRAITANRWVRYNGDAARLLETEILIQLRLYKEALRSLDKMANASADAACLRLQALPALPDLPAFRVTMTQTLDRYPRDPRPVRILFIYAAKKLPEVNEQKLIDTALRQLPLLLETDPDLAWLAVPFIRDTAEARRLVATYRASGGSEPAAIPAALNLGVIDEEAAVEELFRGAAVLPVTGIAPLSAAPVTGTSASAPPVLDKALMLSVWRLLRHDAGRERFTRNLSSFSGVISEDRDEDGYPESRTRYEAGQIREYRYDPNQSGLLEWRIGFIAGEPAEGYFALQQDNGDRAVAQITWERYPWVGNAAFDGLDFRFKPLDFSVTPLRFTELVEGGTAEAFLYPAGDSRGFPRLTRRTLMSFAAVIERPSAEFEGAIEQIELNRGIPLSAAEYLPWMTLSVTEYQSGRPVLQRIDLDRDGRMETVRRFRRDGPPASGDEYPFEYVPVWESSESDWDGDGVYETGEEYLPNRTVARSWDMNNDGIKEFTVINSGE
ncbi:hypothetical protein AGMMS50267_13190 [Spirochaetia bacterium]|nr:hypothetical protein AGMMS50267_13190 [Spirochaetia bacterium]